METAWRRCASAVFNPGDAINAEACDAWRCRRLDKTDHDRHVNSNYTLVRHCDVVVSCWSILFHTDWSDRNMTCKVLSRNLLTFVDIYRMRL